MKPCQSEASVLIEEIIRNRCIELEKYVNTPTAKDSVINIRNAQIQELVVVANKIKDLKFNEIWVLAEAEMQKLEQSDPNLSGHILRIKVNNNSQHFSCSEFDVTDYHD